MREIPVTRGWVTLVDDEDFDALSRHKWYAMKTGHVCRRDYSVPGRPIILMHRVIMGVTDPDVEVDHKFGSPLNNQRYNLRICTHRLNTRNGSMRKNNTSGFKGVVFNKRRGKWMARIKLNYITIHLGYFTDPNLAALAYNEASLKYHGEFGKLNIIPSTSEAHCTTSSNDAA